MTICDQCSSAIKSLRPHNEPLAHLKRESKIYALLPSYQDTSEIKCWICYKFFQWLEVEDVGVFDMWRKESLRVVFHVYARVQIDKPELSPVLAPFFIQILPPGYADLGCEIELNFFTGEGMVVFPKELFLLRNTLHPELILIAPRPFCKPGHCPEIWRNRRTQIRPYLRLVQSMY
jgi:hypothetical protein